MNERDDDLLEEEEEEDMDMGEVVDQCFLCKKDIFEREEWCEIPIEHGDRYSPPEYKYAHEACLEREDAEMEYAEQRRYDEWRDDQLARR